VADVALIRELKSNTEVLMKTKWILLPVVGFVTWVVMATFAQPHTGMTRKEFMREKLGHSQKALEALAVEDFSTLAQQSKKLSAMTQEATWEVFQNPDYAQHSATFRRHANSLSRAAQEKDIDAATLAYVRLTMSCVDCHKLVRGKLVASTDLVPLAGRLAAR
jgi:cytochrome c556